MTEKKLMTDQDKLDNTGNLMKLFQRKETFASVKLPVTRKRGFTLVELLIVITIITILATIIVISFVNAQAKSRDGKRRADVRTIANALQAYHMDTKSWRVLGPPPDNAGTGFVVGGLPRGFGWFNKTGTGANYPAKSIAVALVERKFLIEALKDPKMTNNNDITDNFQYYIWYCPSDISLGDFANYNGLAVLAKLESPNQQDEDSMTEESNKGSKGCITRPPMGGDGSSMNFIVTVH